MKIKNLYNLDSFDELIGCGHKLKDSDAGTVLARSLTFVNPQILEKKYPELSFMNSGITANNQGGVAKRIQSLRLLDSGSFKNRSDIAGNKGKISLTAEDTFLKVIQRDAHSEWNDTEVKQAALENINLVSSFISGHNKIYMRELDDIGYTGGEVGEGLLNYSGFASTAATGAVGTLTAQEMYDDVSGLITLQNNQVFNTPEYMVTNVDMPVTVFNKLNETMLNTANGSSTVLKALKDNYPGVKFNATARAESVSGSSRTVAYNNSDQAMVFRVPVPLQVSEIIKVSGFDFRLDSKYHVGGLDVLEDTAGYILTGL